ncbi:MULTISPECIES: VOC family protein [Olivibacter]|jgi:predicted enzyme related to lactoylglutathione lyase|uniref:Glyoxalase/bleomycin resistance protein/dioxygenase n=3 Tax=Sphingobacteriaceae TaxID=84566 RepID=F4CBC7_SPHS2|nr:MULTISPECIES: VOC family protein [Olivibacter]MDM8173749.1 VOC family protein [Olivibacter sp. 47]MDX3914936.1 VOC family protein [Pseudosphingobacterium sp.]QEL03545.1 glyoxalase/bleomycin resistance/dioxygenase family protein [Olivibacter sp. LS-1]
MGVKLKKGIAVLFNVSDISRTERFYREILGIEVERQPGGDEPDWLLATIGNGVELLFFEGKEEIGRSPIVVFELEEGYIETVVENLAKEGVEVVTPVTEAPGGWSADFSDPDGHPLAFYQSGDLPLRK